MDDEQSEGVFYAVSVPCWRFSLWDVAGITLHTAATVTQGVSQGLALMAREFSAAANRSRQNFDFREAKRLDEEARKAMSDDLERLMLNQPTEDS